MKIVVDTLTTTYVLDNKPTMTERITAFFKRILRR